jgi:hypothetical protein
VICGGEVSLDLIKSFQRETEGSVIGKYLHEVANTRQNLSVNPLPMLRGCKSRFHTSVVTSTRTGSYCPQDTSQDNKNVCFINCEKLTDSFCIS